MTESAMGSKRYWKSVAGLFLYYLPVLYLGVILGVTLHEIAGHGLAALAMGGRFRGFGIYLDGMGWADIDVAALPAPRIAFVLLAGGLCTSVFALIFFILGMALKERPYVHAALLMCAFICFMDGVPYFFWDAIYLSGVGDLSVIYRLYPVPLLRITVISLCGLLMTAGIVAFNVLFYGVSYRRLREYGPVTLTGRIELSILLFLLQAAGWFAFDWNSLVPGVGLLPGISAMAVTTAVLAFLIRGRVPADPAVREPVTRGGRWSRAQAIAAWGACAAVALATVFWSGNGVSF